MDFFDNKRYQDLLNSLEKCIYPFITCTEPKMDGQYREAVFYQIEHGTRHLNQVRANMEIFLKSALEVKSPPHKIEDMDIFIALASASFHDIGMHIWHHDYPNIKEPLDRDHSKIIRDNHASIAAKWFEKAATADPPSELQLSPEEKELLSETKLNKWLTFVIENYSKSLKELDHLFKTNNIDKDEQKRIKFLCCLLKLADVFDMDKRRVQDDRIRRGIKHLIEQPSQIQPKIKEIIRFFMSHYCFQCKLSKDYSPKLQFKIDLRLPGSMLKDSAYKPFLNYLKNKYSDRLRDTDNIIGIINDYCGLAVIPSPIPDFTYEASQIELDKRLLNRILKEIVKMEPILLLEDWVKSKMPKLDDSSQKIYPTWEEFENEIVFLNSKDINILENILENNQIALVAGKGICGKTVFGVGFGRHWSNDLRLCYWLDLREQEGLTIDTLSKYFKKFSQMENNFLLVIDNAHLRDDFVDLILEQSLTENFTCKVLLLARAYSPQKSYVKANFYEKMKNKTIFLKTGVPELKGVATRLLARANLTQAWSDLDYERWLHEFGGDLIAFGCSLLKSINKNRISKPNRQHALEYIRESYLDYVRGVPEGLTLFLKLCAVASLDLSISEQALCGSIKQVYSKFVQEGIVNSIQQGIYRRWHFIHPGLAELILETYAIDNGEDKDILKRYWLLKVCEKDPSMLADITTHLSNGRYVDLKEFPQWCSTITKGNNLIEKAFAYSPYSILKLNEKHNLTTKTLYKEEHRSTLLSSFCQTPPNLQIEVLKYIAKELGEEKAKELLQDLVKNNKECLLVILEKSPPDHITTFLKYLDDQGEEEKAGELLQDLEKTVYFPTLINTSPGHLTIFLKYISRKLGKKKKQEIFDDLIRNRNYLSKLSKSPPGPLTSFLKCISNKKKEKKLLQDLEYIGYFSFLINFTLGSGTTIFLKYVHEELGEEEKIKNLLQDLIKNDEYFSTLKNSPLGQLIPFLNFIINILGKEKAGEVLQALENKGYFSNIENFTIADLTKYFQYISCTFGGKEKVEEMLENLRRKKYLHVLKKGPPAHIVSFLKYILDTFGEKRAKEMLRDLMKNEDYFSSFISKRRSFEQLTIFFNFVVKRYSLQEEDLENLKELRFLLKQFYQWILHFNIIDKDVHVEFDELSPVLKVAGSYERNIAKEIINWIITNENEFREWIVNAPENRRVRLGKAIKKAKVFFREDLFNLLWE